MTIKLTEESDRAYLEEIDVIKEIVATNYGVMTTDIDGTSRKVPLPMIRHIAMVLSYRLAGASLWDVAEAFKKDNHGGVCHAIDATRARCDTDKKFKNAFMVLEDRCRLAIINLRNLKKR